VTVMQHLHSRYMNTDLHRAWVSEELECATFPLWNLSSQIVGYQRYRPNGTKEKNNDPHEGRYFTRVKDKRVGVWGLESWNLSNTLFVTEGIFDACRLTALGYASIATLSNDVFPGLKSWLWTVRKFRCVVAVCDGDDAGRRLAKFGHISHVVESGDLGDASEEYVRNLAKKYG